MLGIALHLNLKYFECLQGHLSSTLRIRAVFPFLSPPPSLSHSNHSMHTRHCDWSHYIEANMSQVAANLHGLRSYLRRWFQHCKVPSCFVSHHEPSVYPGSMYLYIMYHHLIYRIVLPVHFDLVMFRMCTLTSLHWRSSAYTGNHTQIHHDTVVLIT